MGAHKNYNYKIHTDITRAMNKYNKIMTGPRFNTIDGNILNLIKSFYLNQPQNYPYNCLPTCITMYI